METHTGLPKQRTSKIICLRRLHLPQVAVPSEFTLEALRSFLDIEGDGLEAVRVAFRNLEALTDEISLGRVFWGWVLWCCCFLKVVSVSTTKNRNNHEVVAFNFKC